MIFRVTFQQAISSLINDVILFSTSIGPLYFHKLLNNHKLHGERHLQCVPLLLTDPTIPVKCSAHSQSNIRQMLEYTILLYYIIRERTNGLEWSGKSVNNGYSLDLEWKYNSSQRLLTTIQSITRIQPLLFYYCLYSWGISALECLFNWAKWHVLSQQWDKCQLPGYNYSVARSDTQIFGWERNSRKQRLIWLIRIGI